MAILSSDHVKMTSVLEKAITVIAPHRCIVCSNYDNVLCTACVQDVCRLEAPVCLLCGVETAKWQPCRVCAAGTALKMAQAATIYDGTIKELIHRFKFDHARSAYKPLATLIAASLPSFSPDWIIVPIPTVTAHIRRRSYDHALLLAKEVAMQKNIPLQSVLRRSRDYRQVGAGRVERQKQARNVFETKKTTVAKRVLLIDDVCTTGATLSAAAATLKGTGATEVWGAVAAWQQPRL